MELDPKILDRMQKLKAIATGSSNSKSDSAEIANEALVAMMMLRKLLQQHHVDESILQAKAAEEKTVYVAPSYGVSTFINPYRRANARGLNKRRIWIEKLASVVAEGNYCKIGIIPEQGAVEFYGLEMDREVAMFTLDKLAQIADNICKVEIKLAQVNAGGMNFTFGAKTGAEKKPAWVSDDCFIESFHQGFREKIKELFTDDDGNMKTSSGVEDFWNINCYYSKKPDFVWSNRKYAEDESPIEQYYVNIGDRIAEKAIKKLKLSENTSDLQSLVKTNLVKKQERAVKERKQLYAKLGIDETLPRLVFILEDASGSMSGEGKMEQAKKGALEFAQARTKLGDEVGLVTFGLYPEIFLPPTNQIIGQFSETIDRLEACGGTPLHSAIETARKYLVERKNRRTMMIITDGQPNSVERALAEAQIAKDQGIEILVIGTPDAPKQFMDQLASSGNSEQVGNNMLGEGIRRMAGLLSA